VSGSLSRSCLSNSGAYDASSSAGVCSRTGDPAESSGGPAGLGFFVVLSSCSESGGSRGLGTESQLRSYSTQYQAQGFRHWGPSHVELRPCSVPLCQVAPDQHLPAYRSLRCPRVPHREHERPGTPLPLLPWLLICSSVRYCYAVGRVQHCTVVHEQHSTVQYCANRAAGAVRCRAPLPCVFTHTNSTICIHKQSLSCSPLCAPFRW